MKPILPDPALVAACGLYCGACGSYRKGRCPGCAGNETATWCGVRACCRKNGFATCAECRDHANPADCPTFHNFISRVIGFVLRSDRAACIRQIRKLGVAGHAQAMAGSGRQTLPRGTR